MEPSLAVTAVYYGSYRYGYGGYGRAVQSWARPPLLFCLSSSCVRLLTGRGIIVVVVAICEHFTKQGRGQRRSMHPILSFVHRELSCDPCAAGSFEFGHVAHYVCDYEHEVRI